MTYADTLLATNEQIVLRTRQHPVALLRAVTRGLLLWLIAVVILWAVVWFNVSGGLQTIAGLIALLLFLVGLAQVIWKWLHYFTNEYIVTNRRLLKVSGLINKESADSSLEKINDAILTVSMFGRVLNYGDLEILTAAEQSVDKYRMLNGARQFKIAMLDEKHNLELELSGAARPSAPLRAAPPPTPDSMPTATVAAMPAADASTPPPPSAPPAMADAPPPPPPAPPADASLEVTQTLARLADLRDRGAITPEEYEAKKAELLGRL
jgi:putative oligomerization/nucleic acid binding protein/PH (Pleckstrin Homology) domain-containing protein